MARPLDYNKHTSYRYTSHNTTASSRRYNACLVQSPTQEMIRYNKFLVELCKENGLGNMFEYSGEDRALLYKYNGILSRKLTDAGIDYTELWHSKKKFKFDKDGNIVDAWTGKIVTKRN